MCTEDRAPPISSKSLTENPFASSVRRLRLGPCSHYKMIHPLAVACHLGAATRSIGCLSKRIYDGYNEAFQVVLGGTKLKIMHRILYLCVSETFDSS